MPLFSLTLVLSTLLAPPLQDAVGDDTAPVGGATSPAMSAMPAPNDAPLRPTLQEIFQPPTLLGVRATNSSLSPSGEWITWRWTDADTERPERDLWLGRSDGSEARVLHTHTERATAEWMPNEDRLLVKRDGWLFAVDPADSARPDPLLEIGNGRFAVTDDGELLVASLGDDKQLWVLELPTGRRWRVGEDLTNRSAFVSVAKSAAVVALWADAPDEPSPSTNQAPTNAAPPAPPTDAPPTDAQPATATPARKDSGSPARPQQLWVLSLLGNGTPKALEIERSGNVDLSADGRWVLRRNSRYDFGRELIMADYLSENVRAIDVRDSLAGDDGTRVELSLHSVESGESWTPPLSGMDRWYLRGEHFAPSGDQVLIDLLSNDFKVRQLVVLDPTSRRSTVVAREYDAAWIGAPFWWSGWQDSDNVLFTSEESGFNHLYRVSASGGDAEALTSGDFEVRDLCEDALRSQRTALVTTHPDDPATHRALVLDLRTGAQTILTPDASVASNACLSPLGNVVSFDGSQLGLPAELCTRAFEADGPSRLRTAGAIRTLTHTRPAALDELALPAPEIVRYRNPDDGVLVSAYLYKPEPFDPAKQYPAVIFAHGAGSLQQVLRSMGDYEPNMLFHHRLARQGFYVLDPDFRHSTGYGRDFRAGIYGHMGGKDLDDIVAGVDYLSTLGNVDTARVGLYGGSYGGFLTLMALFTKPDVFAAGAALRSVTDWRQYNHWYTNARLGHPVRNAENYERSNPLSFVEGLEDPLLILHGLKDNNVFAQDSIRLIEALIELGKDFDAMLYPSQGHGFTDPDSWIDEYKRIERLFVRELKPGASRDPAFVPPKRSSNAAR
ncbi:MAG: hypothetical protein DHS20C15_13990 [Planctomycetota bacterium]|nr:MAG: hypothetical protein DHS20C15_13990 [Planctomycetota bacterium]